MPENLQIEIKAFDALTLVELHACLKLRGEVFVVGQQICSVPDVDELDPACDHVIVMVGQRVVGTARLQTLSATGPIKVGRLAVSKAHRGKGLGRSIMCRVHAELRERGLDGVMHAQAYLETWYAELGWVRQGEPFVEAGIEHIEMCLTLSAGATVDL